MSRFGNDMKVDGIVNSKEGCLKLQQDINQLESWAENW